MNRRVIVMPHATQRLKERSAKHASLTLHEAVKSIRRQVVAALDEDRRKTRCPKWADRWGVSDLRRLPGTTRFVWPPDEAYCFVIVRQDGDDGHSVDYTETWRVITVLPRLTDEQMHETRQRLKSLKQMGSRERRDNPKLRNGRPRYPQR